MVEPLDTWLPKYQIKREIKKLEERQDYLYKEIRLPTINKKKRNGKLHRNSR